MRGISTANLGAVDYSNAVKQHESYVQALETCGLDVTVLPADERFPDSVFVEDAALMTPHCAIVTNPGAPSRRGETEDMLPVVKSFYENVYRINAPGTVEAGDIMMVKDHYYIGLSARTDALGAAQLMVHLRAHGMTGSIVPLSEVLHLKTGLGYLENDYLLACGEFVHHPAFRKFKMLQVDPSESYAANSVWVNDTVLVPEGFPKTRKLIESAGFATHAVDVSEYRKLDGGLSCLSLRF